MRENKYLAVIFIVMFLFGYNLMTASTQQCSAFGGGAPSVGGGLCRCCAKPPCPEPCSPSGTASTLGSQLSEAFHENMSQAANTLEEHVGEIVDDMMETLLTRLNQTEMDIIDWWNTMWFYNLLPSMQAITRQLGTATTDQSRTLHSAIDAGNQNEVNLAWEGQGVSSQREAQPSEKVCVAATTSGGYGRATTFSKAMRQGWENESQLPGLNKKGTPGASAAAATEKIRYQEYKSIFCDPDGNGGQNDCAATDPKYRNADTQPTKFIYDKLTIDVDDDPVLAKTIETITNNMVGVPSADPISKGALESATGEQVFLERRAYLARYAAVRSVPQMIMGWRMPGSKMGDFVKGIRQGAGAPLADISDNPSYREIVHAMSVDRFNSGKFALGMISSASEIEMEKLTVNAFYLMQLRDYYELLERTAMVLAVQVAIMADQIPMPAVSQARPLK